MQTSKHFPVAFKNIANLMLTINSGSCINRERDLSRILNVNKAIDQHLPFIHFGEGGP
jgi:hypothetical protein